MKKQILLTLIIISLITACSNLKKSFGSSSYNKSYQERLSAFSSESTKNRFTLLGDKYNYTFTQAKELVLLFKNQKELKLNSSNMSLNIRVKEYKSSIVTLTLFSHFEKGKLNAQQIKLLETNHYALEERARLGGKKSEPRPVKVPTYVKLWTINGEREKNKLIEKSEKLISEIFLEVAEHIKR